jgi:hippurate hydrolase
MSKSVTQPTTQPLEVVGPRPVSDKLFDRLVALRRDLHQHPELGWRETRTASRIEAELDRLGITHHRVGETGVLADLSGPEGVPAVALRADMDGLPIPEETGLPYASEEPGLMHACGHDGHITIVLGAAELLLAKDDRPAPVRLVFQPAEELGDGAKRMIDAGALEGVGMIFGGHLDRHYEPGTIIVSDGPVNASADAFRVQISGREGHAGRPHEAVDAIVVGSLMVMALQTIVSREINPDHPSVVSIGMFRAGKVSNAIAGQAELQGTIRAQDVEVRQHLKASVQRVAETTALLHGADLEFEFTESTPILYNRSPATDYAREAARSVVPNDKLIELEHANMGGEDFSRYLNEVPGCYVRYGARVKGREGFPSHSSKFEFDEEALAVGAAWMAEIAMVAGREILKE